MRDRLLRYAISIAFVVFIAACISTFYILAAESRYPDFKIITEQGDDAELENVSLQGSYGNTRMHHYRLDSSMSIDENGSHYASERSFFERLDRVYDEEMRQLRKDYRSFMRGKEGVNSFYNDKAYLVYANVEAEYFGAYPSENFYFDVAILNKNSNEISAFQFELPDSQLYLYINVVDVQMFEEEIVVVTRNHYYTDMESDYHKYTFNMNDAGNSNLTHERIEFSIIQESDDRYVNVINVGQAKITQPARHMVFYYTESQEVAREQSVALEDEVAGENEAVTVQAAANYDSVTYDYEVVNTVFLAYDLQTGQMEPIQSEAITDMLASPFSSDQLHLNLEGEKLYITLKEAEAVHVIEYNLLDASAQTYEIITDPIDMLHVSKERLYALTNLNRSIVSDPTKLKIYDIYSGQLVYEGKVDLDDNKYDEEVLDQLYIRQIVLK